MIDRLNTHPDLWLIPYKFAEGVGRDAHFPAIIGELPIAPNARPNHNTFESTFARTPAKDRTVVGIDLTGLKNPNDRDFLFCAGLRQRPTWSLPTMKLLHVPLRQARTSYPQICAAARFRSEGHALKTAIPDGTDLGVIASLRARIEAPWDQCIPLPTAKHVQSLNSWLRNVPAQKSV